MGILDFFTRAKEVHVEPLRLDWMQVDVHSHLIPGIDDGAKNMEDSISMIRRLHEMGLRKIITTPHVMSEFYKNTPEIIQLGLKDVKKALKKENIDIEIEAAAEYYLDEIFLDKVQKGEKLLTLANNYVLVETGFINKPQMLFEIFFAMEMQGYKPVFAHPERYQYLIQDKKFFGELLDRDVYFQLNLLSLTGFYSKPIKNFAEMLIDEKKVKFFGTDCHNHRYLDMLETLPKSKYYEKLPTIDALNKSL
ncbi:tyrosine-protein phosphatase [Mongoliitalea daihaiensis]|uniref:tyrosine-protein phosphatase n=1 Tax=Mongoliitalea daihaiensis TaxID=2782006 RepID=UPI001F421AD6|nr:CpsB/CapC family capsule biosynthesis tyrosine phosphatase [Mongoliitalea daihaiensis]UJP65790.1 capsular biosynthesis protein [Mongoliitalea daihaiensis]